jgi:hypothetical protein
MDKSKKNIEKQYDKIMRGFSYDFPNQKWEKEGDFYKQFSLYDTNKYDTSTSYSVII